MTRLVELHPQTIADAADDFGGSEHVPRRAITMGVATILAARQIVLMAWGSKKAPIIKRALEGEVLQQRMCARWSDGVGRCARSVLRPSCSDTRTC